MIDIFVGGWLVDALIRAGHDAGRVRRRVLLLGMVCGLGVAGPALTHHPIPALLSVCVGIGGLSAAAPVGWSLPGILVPTSSTGKVGGIMNFGSQISAIIAPVITGYLTSWTHTFAAAFALAAFLLLIGLAATHFCWGRSSGLMLHKSRLSTRSSFADSQQLPAFGDQLPSRSRRHRQYIFCALG